MRAFSSLTTLLAFVGSSTANDLLCRAACNADNCARAVTGTAAKPPQTSRLADCSSFFLVTVTPASSTSTVTVTPAPTPVTTTVTTVLVNDGPTVTSTDYEIERPTTTAAAAAGKRQASGGGAVTNSPTAVPAYASACAGTARYSSACACAGVAKSTTTVPAGNTTVTVTATAPATTVPVNATSTISSTQTAVATVTETGVPCGSILTFPNCQMQVICDVAFSQEDNFDSYNLNEYDCAKKCSQQPGCVGAGYDYSLRYGATGPYCATFFYISDETVPVRKVDSFRVISGYCY